MFGAVEESSFRILVLVPRLFGSAPTLPMVVAVVDVHLLQVDLVEQQSWQPWSCAILLWLCSSRVLQFIVLALLRFAFVFGP